VRERCKWPENGCEEIHSHTLHTSGCELLGTELLNMEFVPFDLLYPFYPRPHLNKVYSPQGWGGCVKERCKGPENGSEEIYSHTSHTSGCLLLRTVLLVMRVVSFDVFSPYYPRPHLNKVSFPPGVGWVCESYVLMARKWQ